MTVARDDLDQGDSWSFEVEMRRPPEAAYFLVGPKVDRTSSFYLLGGPYWVKEI